MNFLIRPIFPVKERTSEERFQVRRPIDSRISGFVLEKIGQTKSALLPSVSSPEMISFLVPGLQAGINRGGKKVTICDSEAQPDQSAAVRVGGVNSKTIDPRGRIDMAKPQQADCHLFTTPVNTMGYFQQKRKRRPLKLSSPREKPIGLMPPEPEGWVCAIMQFILHVPQFADLFSLAPRSFFPIQEFIDQYRQDIEEGKSLSMANGQALFRLFHFRFPNFSPAEIVGALMSLISPKWKIFNTIQEALLFAKAPDLFLYAGALRKQIYAAPGPYYDLDAFIEKRPDGVRSNYICHVKVDGCWYQCDDERITQLRSDLLAIPLQRSIISHYAQVRF